MSNVRYNLSVDWISIEESIVLHQLDVVEQQLADIQGQDSGGYIRVYIRGNTPETESDDSSAMITHDQQGASSSSASIHDDAAVFHFVTISDENMATESALHGSVASGTGTPPETDEHILDTISVFPSLSHEDLSTSLSGRISVDSNRRRALPNGLLASTSQRDIRSLSQEAQHAADHSSEPDAARRITVRSSSSNERIDASHKSIQAGKSIGSLSGHPPAATSAKRLVPVVDRYRGSNRATSSTVDGRTVDKVTRSSSTDELTAGSLQIYDSTGTFRVPSSPKSRKAKTPANGGYPQDHQYGDQYPISDDPMATRMSTRSSVRHTGACSSNVAGRTSPAVRDSTRSLPVDMHETGSSDGRTRTGYGLKRQVYNLRSMSTKRTELKKLKKPVPVTRRKSDDSKTQGGES